HSPITHIHSRTALSLVRLVAHCFNPCHPAASLRALKSLENLVPPKPEHAQAKIYRVRRDVYQNTRDSNGYQETALGASPKPEDPPAHRKTAYRVLDQTDRSDQHAQKPH